MTSHPPFYVSIPPQFPAEHLKRLKARREVIRRLCSTLEEYLALDLDEQIAQASAPPPEHQRPTFTPEMLVGAQSDLQQTEEQLRKMEELLDKAKDLPEEMQFSVSMMESMGLPLLLREVEGKRDYVTMIQESLDGKHYSLACGKCYRFLDADGSLQQGVSRATFRGTKEECSAKATEHGWVTDGDEHTCPECAA